MFYQPVPIKRVLTISNTSLTVTLKSINHRKKYDCLKLRMNLYYNLSAFVCLFVCLFFFYMSSNTSERNYLEYAMKNNRIFIKLFILLIKMKLYGYGLFSLILIEFVMFGVTFNLVARVGPT